MIMVAKINKLKIILINYIINSLYILILTHCVLKLGFGAFTSYNDL